MAQTLDLVDLMALADQASPVCRFGHASRGLPRARDVDCAQLLDLLSKPRIAGKELYARVFGTNSHTH